VVLERFNWLAKLLHQHAHRRRDGSALILLYHRIADEEVDPWSLCVSPANFAEHLELLRQQFNPISLLQLVNAIREGNIQQRSVVVTFDDGYADNFYCAKPLLEKYGVAATFFVTSGYLGKHRGFWWDELAHAVLSSRSLPPVLRLHIGNRVLEWRFEQPSERDACYHAVYKLLRSAPAEHRYLILDDIFGSLCSLPDTAHCRPMTEQELVSAARSPLIEIGAHTVTHPVLSQLDAPRQWLEITQSKAALEKLIGQQVRTFAYPYGTADAFSEETKQLIRESGFDAASVAFGGGVHEDSDQFELPRLTIKDMDGDALDELLDAEFNA
jgi:peptidoglycan/xylan/chitin deacetylase (PgdA/CDA1 family)